MNNKTTKPLIAFSLAIFFLSLIWILFRGFTAETNSQQKNVSTNTVTTADVAKHNTQSDCWIIIDSKAYDITSYFGKHPGGDKTISSYCGKEATTAFNKIPHSNYAQSLLKNYLVGDISTTNNSNQTSNSATTSASITLTVAEVQKHNTASSCWAILSDNVYDLTNFKTAHSGGSSTISCGVDATSTILKKHGSSYISLLSGYKIGAVGQTINQTSPAPSTPSPTDTEEVDDDDSDD